MEEDLPRAEGGGCVPSFTEFFFFFFFFLLRRSLISFSLVEERKKGRWVVGGGRGEVRGRGLVFFFFLLFGRCVSFVLFFCGNVILSSPPRWTPHGGAHDACHLRSSEAPPCWVVHGSWNPRKKKQKTKKKDNLVQERDEDLFNFLFFFCFLKEGKTLLAISGYKKKKEKEKKAL